jgi:serine/threonine-protein kinase
MNGRDVIVRPLPDHAAAAKTSRRCPVARDRASGSRFRGEMGQLLHARLRTVTFIALVPAVLFLVRNLIEPHPQALMSGVGVALQGGLAAFLGGLGWLLWHRSSWSLAALRRMELALFGLLTVYFCWLQVSTFRSDALFAPPLSDSPIEIIRLRIGHTAVRWFFLIVIYGVFIPNTWQRCAALTGVAALAPLILTPLGAVWYDRHSPEVLYGILDLAILMLTAVAVAVFGAYRLQVLQQQAFQAEQLGQYRLGARIGTGGMGEVYLGEHVLLRRPCAIKLIRPDQMRDPSVLQRFEREVRAMATLTHWNTVEVYDYGRSDDGTFYYVMEYLPGPTLEALVARHGPLPPERALHFLRQVCRALHEAHGIGLLHRDIKPSNIIACTRGGLHDVAKLLDFGLVQENGLTGVSGRLTIQGTVLGSPPYMAPEQAAARTDVDLRTDIYSLGAVGYFLLTGQPPFVRETAMEMMLAHAYEPVVPPSELRPGVPADLEAVILHCMNKKPEDRYPSADALEKALATCAAANQWTEEQAAAWWVSAGEETTALDVPALPTPQEV